ncbi:MAG: class I SAM-dependent methyltransferase [Deltaproteobacteria bacterium]|nr:MAG: class I SAM-dependent methyltransferase [Deltaproteobacteria bacterium]
MKESEVAGIRMKTRGDRCQEGGRGNRAMLQPLADVPADKAVCPLCASMETTCWFRGADTDHCLSREFSLFRCRACGLGFVSPLPSEAEIERLYPPRFYRRKERGGERFLSRLLGWYEALTYRRRLAWIGNAAPGRTRLLDVGCGNGRFLALAASAGWVATGVEASPAGAAAARSDYGLTVHEGFLPDLSLPPASFDAITMWHVLEHIPEFQRVVECCRDLLRPGGRLVIAVPNFAGVEARCFREKWALFDLPRHVVFFTPQTLRRLVGACGLVPIREAHFSLEFNVPIAIQNVLNLLCTEKMFLYNVAKRNYTRADVRHPEAYRRNLLLSLAGAFLLGPPALLVSVAASLIGRGTTYTLCAESAGA